MEPEMILMYGIFPETVIDNKRRKKKRKCPYCGRRHRTPEKYRDCIVKARAKK